MSTLRAMPNLTPEARREGLIRLGKAYTTGTAPAETDAAVLITMYASEKFGADRAIELFADYVAEVERAVWRGSKAENGLHGTVGPA